MIALVGVDRAPGALVTLILMRELSITGAQAVAAAEGSSQQILREIKNFSRCLPGFLMIHYPTLWLPCHQIGIILLWFATSVTLWTGWQYFREFYFESN